MDEELNLDLPAIEEESKDEYMSYKLFKGTAGRDELRTIASNNKISYQRITKEQLYNLLLEKGLIPKK